MLTPAAAAATGRGYVAIHQTNQRISNSIGSLLAGRVLDKSQTNAAYLPGDRRRSTPSES